MNYFTQIFQKYTEQFKNDNIFNWNEYEENSERGLNTFYFLQNLFPRRIYSFERLKNSVQ